MAPLIAVTGTGTEIGKTHAAQALLAAWASAWPNARLVGLKPVETGGTADGDALGRMSTFHVKRFQAPYMLKRPVSPHLAARDEGRTIEVGPIVAQIEAARRETDGVLVELAGGLFSPLAPGMLNLDVLRALQPSTVVLVAPDRLGVLHDVIATVRAAATAVHIDWVLLSSPKDADTSTGTNADELTALVDTPIAGTLPRASVEALQSHHALTRIVAALSRG